jgi:phi LC3 family holin
MKINWKLRLQNPASAIALIVALVSVVYEIAQAAGVQLPVEQDEAVRIIEVIAGFVLAVGVVVDPTTKGVSDSERAQEYDTPA